MTSDVTPTEPPETDESGRPLVTPIVLRGVCEVCGVQIHQRSEGRTRRFCGRTCRSKAWRSTPRLF